MSCLSKHWRQGEWEGGGLSNGALTLIGREYVAAAVVVELVN